MSRPGTKYVIGRSDATAYFRNLWLTSTLVEFVDPRQHVPEGAEVFLVVTEPPSFLWPQGRQCYVTQIHQAYVPATPRRKVFFTVEPSKRRRREPTPPASFGTASSPGWGSGSSVSWPSGDESMEPPTKPRVCESVAEALEVDPEEAVAVSNDSRITPEDRGCLPDMAKGKPQSRESSDDELIECPDLTSGLGLTSCLEPVSGIKMFMTESTLKHKKSKSPARFESERALVEAWEEQLNATDPKELAQEHREPNYKARLEFLRLQKPKEEWWPRNCRRRLFSPPPKERE
ncbi:unnamed protein product [Trichogramma brassicae]|uniref:Uncharacterized protein n=1 Tax=Trichogramma brassicae TaxID=86971 RepID=A0A6H5HXQ9_9HYME|nr:unnamed protein product [Trichogramma brassicae]